MKLHIGYRGAAASLGLICAATLWAVNMQLGEVLPYPACRARLPFAGISSSLSLALSLVAGYCSWRAFAALRQGWKKAPSDARRSLHLLAGLGAGGALLFGFALILQALAGFILSGCER